MFDVYFSVLDNLVFLYVNSSFSICSGQKEDLYLPTFDCMFPSIAELKTVPKSAVLVVGHNGFGEFGIWYVAFSF